MHYFCLAHFLSHHHRYHERDLIPFRLDVHRVFEHFNVVRKLPKATRAQVCIVRIQRLFN